MTNQQLYLLVVAIPLIFGLVNAGLVFWILSELHDIRKELRDIRKELRNIEIRLEKLEGPHLVKP